MLWLTLWLSSNSFAEGYYDAAVACPLLLFIWELSRLSLCTPIALETLLEAGRNVRAVLRVPPHLLLLWLGTLFSRLAARPEKQQQQLRGPAQASPSGGKEQCLWLPVPLHIRAHGFSYTFVSTTLPFLGTRGPSVSHRWCLEPPVSLWWHSSALALCTFWFSVGTCKATRHK